MFLHSQTKASLYQVSCQWLSKKKKKYLVSGDCLQKILVGQPKQNLVNKYTDKVK